ncbi:hypothetical protein MPLB_1510219 [Mesorhizobium sp. ORS 3324]|nr:hypothetical protein MPLB_1510219 [Mesorhizobium sp. ORS 3324]
MPADGLCRLRRRCRAAPRLHLEQPGAGDRDDRRQLGPHRRRHPRQRRQSARRRGALGAAARKGQGQQCFRLARAVHPAVRRNLLHRRREARHGAAQRRGRGRVLAGGRKLDGRDQPLARGVGAGRDGAASPVSGRAGALSRHDVRAVEGSRREGQGFYPQGRRFGHHLVGEARRAHQPRAPLTGLPTLDLRRQPPHARSRQGRSPLAPRQGDVVLSPPREADGLAARVPEKIAPELMQSDGIADGAFRCANIHWRWRLASGRKRECSKSSGRRWQEMRFSGRIAPDVEVIFNMGGIECYRG